MNDEPTDIGILCYRLSAAKALYAAVEVMGRELPPNGHPQVMLRLFCLQFIHFMLTEGNYTPQQLIDCVNTATETALHAGNFPAGTIYDA